MDRLSLLRRSTAEGVGAFALVTGGCGAIVVNHATGALGHVGAAASFGLVIMVMIAAVGHLSGAHFNPAVTVAFALTRHFPWRDVPAYVVGQLLGAVGGALVLRACFGLEGTLGVTMPSGSPLRALGIEILLSAVLMFVITSVVPDSSFGTRKTLVNRRKLLIAALVLGLLLTLPLVARAFRVAGSSDVPEFFHGDFVLVNQAAYDFRLPFRERPLLRWAKPSRGDVVLFRQPGAQGVAFKTVIGLPGEQVEIRAGRVTIDGYSLQYDEVAPHVLPGEAEGALAREHGYKLDHLVVRPATAESFGPIEIPENHYFLLGSNRANSIDSRHFGPVPGSEIRGEVYLNLSDLWRPIR